MIIGPVFKKSNLGFYEIIEKPGTHIVQVSSRVTNKSFIEDGGKSRYLVNLRVAAKDQLIECLDYMGDKTQVPFNEVGKYFITGAIWEEQVESELDLPTKGESVIATFDYVNEILRCVSVTLIPRERLQKFDPDAYDKSKELLKRLLK